MRNGGRQISGLRRILAGCGPCQNLPLVRKIAEFHPCLDLTMEGVCVQLEKEVIQLLSFHTHCPNHPFCISPRNTLPRNYGFQ